MQAKAWFLMYFNANIKSEVKELGLTIFCLFKAEGEENPDNLIFNKFLQSKS